jgi:hypothetical protein
MHRILRSLFTHLCLENPRSHTTLLVKPKKVTVNAESKLQSQNCKSYWNLEVSARVPRLESSYVLICKLYLVTCNFWRSLHCDWCKLCKAHSCEVPPPRPQKKKKKRKKKHLTCVEDFNIEHWVGPSGIKMWSSPGQSLHAFSNLGFENAQCSLIQLLMLTLN